MVGRLEKGVKPCTIRWTASYGTVEIKQVMESHFVILLRHNVL